MDGKSGSGMSGLAGGPFAPTPPAGAQQPNPISFSPPQLPNTSSTPGNGPFWGPGSTYIPGYGNNLPELITAQKNAYVLGPDNQWTAAGTNAQIPTGPKTLPAPANAPINSIPGQQLNPFLSQGSADQLRTQLMGQLSGGLKPAEVTGTLSSFFGGLPQMVANSAPAGGYVPGYQIPQSSIQYVPGAAVADLTAQLQNANLKKNGQNQLSSILSGWQSGLGTKYGSPGIDVPTLSQSSGSKK